MLGVQPMRVLGVTTVLVVLTACSDAPAFPSSADGIRTSQVTMAAEPSNRWRDLSDESLWQSVVKADSIADVGLKPETSEKGLVAGVVKLSDSERRTARLSINAISGVTVIRSDTLLPIVRTKLASIESLRLLRRLRWIEYVEPGKAVDITTKPWSSSGCGGDLWQGNVGYLPEGDILPLSYQPMNIPQAWGVSQGIGVTLGLIDTGVDTGRPELANPTFGAGIPTKQIKIRATDGSAGGDACGHGTRMASVIAAPKNGSSIVGVAWGASLYSVRTDTDVFTITDIQAVRDGIRQASDSGVKIASLAFGTVMHYSTIEQEIQWQFYNRDRLYFAAAGTSPCWINSKAVTFPGTLTTVTTVTGLASNGAVDCSAHYGQEVDFAAYVNQPSVGPASGLPLLKLGGSSNATAIVTGIAGLVLSKNPTFSRSQILAALTTAASPTGYRREETLAGALLTHYARLVPSVARGSMGRA
jgi:hypothetical protein